MSIRNYLHSTTIRDRARVPASHRVLAAVAAMVMLAPLGVLSGRVTSISAEPDLAGDGVSGMISEPGGPYLDSPFIAPSVKVPARWYPYLKAPPQQKLHPGMEAAGPGDVRAIAQFHSEPTVGELAALEGMGLSISLEFTVLPALALQGPARAMRGLEAMDAVRYVEPDDDAVHDMEVSTSVINASRTWSTRVWSEGRSGGVVSGTGVTCCVVDTGIDAGHPDLDYGEKTLFNMHYNGVNWQEMENSDLSIGHGTHVAGTVAGNGDASAGARRGVAPDANLIGLSAGNIETEANYLKCLEWVFENSRPTFNPYNIRVATNSWHTSVGEYDPQSALTQVIEKLAFENNVITTWSMGNDGRDDPEGNTITTSQQGVTPVAVVCAAYEHDGSAAAEFTSRGKVGWNHTYPDVGGPGVRIWSCSARRTVISGGTYTGGNTNPYYLAISGTSMSTPHVAGLVALLWQAAPSMGISAMHEDYSGDDPDGWYSNPMTVVHDVELIMEATATHLPADPEHGVPVEDHSTGWGGRPVDYVQGYGIINADRAVSLALTLQRLREDNPGRYVSVHHALRTHENVLNRRAGEGLTDRLSVTWEGEYSRYNDQFGRQLSAVNQTKVLHVPEQASEVAVDLLYVALDTTDWSVVDLSFVIDYGADGSDDYQASLSPSLSGSRHVSIPTDPGNTGMNWAFNIVGVGGRVPRPLEERNYIELRVEYSMSVEVVLDMAAGADAGGDGDAAAAGVRLTHEDYRAGSGMYSFADPSPGYSGGNVSAMGSYFDMDNVVFIPARSRPGPPGGDTVTQLWIILALGIAGLTAFALLRRHMGAGPGSGGGGNTRPGSMDDDG